MELKITQKSVAEIIGVSEDCITYWENGRSIPQVQYFPKLIQFLGYYPFPIDDKSIGGQIQKYRFENGLSHRKLSNITGFDPATLARWEQNMTVPNIEHKIKLTKMDVI